MTPRHLLALLEDIRAGHLTPDEGLRRLAHLPFEDIGAARIDHHRLLRTGLPEVIYGAGKTDEQIAAIFERMAGHGENVLATRVPAAAAARVTERFPAAVYQPLARTLFLRQHPSPGPPGGPVAVVCAGTSDLPVAEEAAATAEALDLEVRRFCDVGVAGLHRLLAQREAIAAARVVIACAGMEGALPTVLGGLVPAPVIAVPTSVGYGASFGGLAALLGMLNSCAPNVAVVNIDNGFGAACFAARIVAAQESPRPESAS